MEFKNFFESVSGFGFLIDRPEQCRWTGHFQDQHLVKKAIDEVRAFVAYQKANGKTEREITRMLSDKRIDCRRAGDDITEAVVVKILYDDFGYGCF